MKVLLINTPIWKETGFQSNYNPGMGLLYIGAVLREKGHEVRIIDAEAMKWWTEEILSEIGIWNPSHVGVSCLSNGFGIAISLVQDVKLKYPNIWVCLGGVGPSCEPERALKESGADSVCVGEGELIVDKVFFEKGIHYGISPEDLDALPMPAYDLMEPIIGGPKWMGNLPRPEINEPVRETVVMWSRGCPHACSFCLPTGTKILTSDLQWKNIEDVKTNEKLIGLVDGTFNKRYTETVVVNIFKRTSEIIKITTENGIVYSSPEHPWLTSHNRWRDASKLKVGWVLRKLSEPVSPPEENDYYKRGYLSGAIYGDGYIGHYVFKTNEKYIGHRFALTGDDEMMETVLRFFEELVDFDTVHRAKFNGGMYKHITSMICSYTRETVARIEEMIDTEEDNDEYKKGFVAGMFDAEGSYSGSSLRISNLNKELLQRTARYAGHFGFKFEYEEKGMRLYGKMPEVIRFFATFNPKVVKKKRNLLTRHLKNNTKILSIKTVPGIMDVYNLETTTGNFVADGFITHNCSKATIPRKYPRMRSPNNIVKELKMLHEKFGINSVFVYDDELIGMGLKHNEWIMNVTEEIWKWNEDDNLNLKIYLKGQGRCSKNFITDSIIMNLKDCGFLAMMMGCESGSDEVKRAIRKGTTNEDIKHSLELLHCYGIKVYGFWMIGMPTETRDEAKKTEKLIEELSPYMDWIQITVFSPLPGSTFWTEAIEKGYLSDYNPASNFQTTAMLDMPWMTKDEILKWQHKLYSVYEHSRKSNDVSN